jgi:hypothetical protein
MSWPGEGTSYRFPEDWDQRATSVVYDFAADLQSLSPEELVQELASRFRSKFVLWDSRTTYLSDLLIAVSLMLADEFPSEGRFRQALDAYPEFSPMPKLAAFAAFELARHENLTHAEFERGELNLLHKEICGLLFEAVVEPHTGRRLTLSNKASQLQIHSYLDRLCVYFRMDGFLDGGAATLATVGDSILRDRETVHESDDFQYSSFVSDRHCSAFSIQSIGDKWNQIDLVRRISDFYAPFRSIGPLKVELECEEDSAWILIARTLKQVDRSIQLKFQMTH